MTDHHLRHRRGPKERAERTAALTVVQALREVRDACLDPDGQGGQPWMGRRPEIVHA